MADGHRPASGADTAGSLRLYAVSCRSRSGNNKWLLESWQYPLNVGQPLPTLPLWLTANLAVPLELEASYEQTCKDLRIA